MTNILRTLCTALAGASLWATVPTATLAQQPPSSTAPTRGTAQLPGDNGKLGVTYQLGNLPVAGNVGQELHFTLESAHVAPFYKTPKGDLIAWAGERLLVLTFWVQNPQTRDMPVRHYSFTFTAVSPDDKNFKASQGVYKADGEAYEGSLKPAQKAKLQVVLPIYATGPIPKLIVQRGSGPVLRYDLRDQVGKMKTTFSPDGLDLVNEVKAELNKPFDVSGMEVEVQEIATHSQIGRFKTNASTNPKTVLVTVQVKYTNLLARPKNIMWRTLFPSMTDTNGEKIFWEQDFLGLGTKTTHTATLEPGESTTGLFVFRAKVGQKPGRLRLLDERARRLVTINLL